MGRIIENNQVTVSGMIEDNFQYSHEIFGEKFYTAHLLSARTSGVNDKVPIMVSERLVDVNQNWGGEVVRVSGCFRSYNRHDETKNRLILSVFVNEFEVLEKEDFLDGENKITLNGYICKEVNYRKTPLGREISDMLLAVNRPYGKSDYIPCICWGRNARFAGELLVGDKIEVEGRIQSREYIKRIDEEHTEERVAYEVSVSKLGQITESED